MVHQTIFKLFQWYFTCYSWGKDKYVTLITLSEGEGRLFLFFSFPGSLEIVIIGYLVILNTTLYRENFCTGTMNIKQLSSVYEGIKRYSSSVILVRETIHASNLYSKA